MTEIKEGLHFTELNIENFKNIQSKKIVLDGQSFVIYGGNGAGKSSLLQALGSYDSTMIPEKAITKGEQRGEISVTAEGNLKGEQLKYLLETFFTPGNQEGRFEVKKNGEEVKSARTVIKNVFGKFFSVDKFLNSSKAEKVKEVKALSGKGVEIDLVDAEIKVVKDRIKYLNENNREKETLLQNHGYSQEELNKYSKPVLLDPIKKALADIGPSVEKWTHYDTKIKEFVKSVEGAPPLIQKEKDGITKCELEKKRLLAEIERIKNLITEQETTITAHNNAITEIGNTNTKNLENIKIGNEWLTKHPKPDAEKISQQLSDAEAHNTHHETIQKYQDKQRDLMKGKEELIAKEEEVKTLEKKRTKIISQSKLPIPGFTFGEDGLFVDGLPFERGQLNTQRILDIGEEIGMARENGLKVILIESGSLYDRESLRTLIKKAEKRGYQVIVELVDPLGGPLQVIPWKEFMLNQIEK